MKKLNNYIQEKLIVNNTIQNNYNYHPKTKDDLMDCIVEKIRIDGYGKEDDPLDLNDIDTSKITDMSYLFDDEYITWHLGKLSKNGHFDISAWDTSNVKNMSHMFDRSGFNGDISQWNVRNVTNMKYMFCKSNFDGDLSNWDVSNVTNMKGMFYDSPLQKNPPKWYKE